MCVVMRGVRVSHVKCVGGVHTRDAHVMLWYMRAVLHAAEDELYQDYLMKNVNNSAFL